jgi:hypothetical protein
MILHLLMKFEPVWKFVATKKHAAIIGAAALLGTIALVQLAPVPPRAQLDAARRAMSTARHAQAAFFVPKDMQAAEESWQRTWEALHESNARWFPLRDFSNAGRLATLTFQQAEAAALRAGSVRDSLALHAIATMLAVKDKMLDVQAAYDEVDMPRAYRGALRHSALMIAECEAAFGREDFILASERAAAALASVSQVSDQTVELIDSYFTSLKEWRLWVKETIDYTDSTGQEAIIVDKLAHLCQIYVAGELVAEYPVELGPRWMGQKQRQGDNATPEGRYFITEKKADGVTRYYKALEISYPNDADNARFLAAKKSGRIPKSAHPGGLIEIHGHGGKGADWTAGCVALENIHIDQVFSMTRIGTPVTIVGSLQGLSRKKLNKIATLRGGR